jgi:hypothetical protein
VLHNLGLHADDTMSTMAVVASVVALHGILSEVYFYELFDQNLFLPNLFYKAW